MQNSVLKWIKGNVRPEDSYLDEAEAVTVTSHIIDLPSFDLRTNQELEECAFTHSVARERERALWELLYRNIPNKASILREILRLEVDAQVRFNSLWLATKVCPSAAPSLVQVALYDDDREVRDWARLYLSEITGTPFQSEYRYGVVVQNRPFDQTLPLQIAGFAVISVLGEDRRIVLSPLWFAYIQGRVMACTRDATFMTNLTIEKAYFGYHSDGGNHYEIYRFAGKSWKSSEERTQHRYLMKAMHPTYLSGKVEEDPENKVVVPIAGNRSATTVGRTIQIFEQGDNESPTTSRTNLPIRKRSIVSNVRGQYFGWAYASTKHYVLHGDILPGTVQLVSPVEPETAGLVNCYICGTFRGKASDHNQDGHLDINEVVCHGSEDGRLDFLGDGSFSPDPFA